MGAKYVTEKDFWMCSCGAVPAQLQGTRKSNKKESGAVFITIQDTATSSWIDFGCTKNMLTDALIGAIVAVVVVVAIVGTGGVAAIGIMGMMAIGAAAGLTAGVISAVEGALTCGQKNATQRTWSKSKESVIATGATSITSDCTMTCKIGGTIAFAPNVKNWMDAVSLGCMNYLTQLAGCAMAGAAVGAGGFLGSGLAAGTLSVTAPTLGSVLTNVAGSFTGIWGTSRVFFGLDALANADAMGKVKNDEDSDAVFFDGAVPEVGMLKRIFTGKAHPSDYMVLLYLLNVKVKEPTTVSEPVPEEENNGNSNNEEDGNIDSEEEQAPESVAEPEPNETPSGEGEFEAYEGAQRLKLIEADPPFRPGESHDVAEFERQIQGQQDGMNDLTVDEFLRNRDEYLANGRSTESANAQDAFRKQQIRAMAEEYRNNDPSLSRKDALSRAKDYYSDQAALHDPDQIAGGHGDRVTGMGDSRVNSSIGSQWKTRIESIDAQVREQAQNMTPEQMRSTKLNIHLYP
ncbi:polymorphic toxin type 15 domain-containing protein [Taibaiella soli]|uniref:Novel toxin 15 domain-containing protein n=1 Tax=Taibaiella soli TaxID=1649169 RepID=A0A2W2B4W8_9BACT|nr:polymorphic toxin type 15 domain-containing protein [Taibaiella soli]PZF71269.1 hypothetical protein DN068_18395 [Taibaiella soli]